MKKKLQENNEHIFNFSQELRDKLKHLMKQRSGKSIDDEEADIYLERMGRLMLSIVKIHEYEKSKKK